MLINTGNHDDYLSNTTTLVAGMQDKIFYLSSTHTAATLSPKCKTQRCCAVLILGSLSLIIILYACVYANCLNIYDLCLFSCVYICFNSETFSFMLTGEDGSRRFGYCRRLLVSHCWTPHPLLPGHTLLSPVCCDRYVICENVIWFSCGASDVLCD